MPSLMPSPRTLVWPSQRNDISNLINTPSMYFNGMGEFMQTGVCGKRACEHVVAAFTLNRL